MKQIVTSLSGILFFLFVNLKEAYPQQVIVGTDQMISAFSPIYRVNDYGAYEILYLSTEINVSGTISRLAFERVDGTNTDPIENVSLYMKQSALSALSSGNFSDTGYTLVYSGTFPNDSGNGWREVILDQPFYYDNTSNLQVLMVKGYQTAIGNTPVSPRWYYTQGVNTRARRYYGSNPVDTSVTMNAVTVHSNVRLDFGTVGIREIFPGNFYVFPNPSAGNVTFHTGDLRNTEEVRLVIYDLSGKRVVEKICSGNSNLTLENIPPGLYMYEFTGTASGFYASGKFIITD